MMRLSLCAMAIHDPALIPIGRRRDSRLRLHIPAQVATIHTTQKAELLDLSQSGAHVALSEPVIQGGDALLTWLNFEAFGRIVWASPTQAGIEFDELLAPAALLITRDLADQLVPKDERRRENNEAARTWSEGYR